MTSKGSTFNRRANWAFPDSGRFARRMMPCGVFVNEIVANSFSLTDPIRRQTDDTADRKRAARSFSAISAEEITASISNPDWSASSARRKPSIKIRPSVFPSRTERAWRRIELSRLEILIIGNYRDRQLSTLPIADCRFLRADLSVIFHGILMSNVAITNVAH